LQGKINWTSKEEVDAPIALLKYVSKYNILSTVTKAFEKIAKDAIGTEAIQSEIHKVVDPRLRPERKLCLHMEGREEGQRVPRYYWS
jgi:hypothetical protein